MADKVSLRSDDLAWRVVEHELIAIDIRESTYLAANSTGTLLWETLSAGATPADLAGVLVETYGIDPDRARDDVESFLQDLRERGILDEASPTR